MASRSISIFDSFLSGGRVGRSFLSSPKALLKASTLTRSLVAWAVLYFWVALRLLRRSSRDSAWVEPSDLSLEEGETFLILQFLDLVCLIVHFFLPELLKDLVNFL